MKVLILISCLLPFALFAQNNPIFEGGTEDGHSQLRTETVSGNPIFNGEREDGYARSQTERQSSSAIFSGGREDGYHMTRQAQATHNAVFEGGTDDGYNMARIRGEDNSPIFAGGREDGYALRRLFRADNHLIFNGGREDGYDQFRIIGVPPSVNPNLPVEILGFDAWWEKEQIRLYWLTVDEENVDYFEVERSLDAQIFTPVLRRKAAAAPGEIMEYEDWDTHPLPEKSYYRLRAVDLDGQWTYSSIVSVSREPVEGLELSLYPNPSSGKVNLILKGNHEARVQIYLTDLLGRRLMAPTQKHPFNGLLRTELDISSYPEGLYIVIVELEGSGLLLSEKVQKR